ncbi:hypothetical protein [Nostoc sp. FACHB-152]|nr:hypothetical protein [Nostoc sp. FACHB-152]
MPDWVSNLAVGFRIGSNRAFQQWCEEEMPGDPREFCYGAIAVG